MPTLTAPLANAKKTGTPSAYEKLQRMSAQALAPKTGRLWERIFGQHADFVLPNSSRTNPAGTLEDTEAKLLSFEVTRLTIHWMEMEEAAGPFGTHQKTY